MRSLEEVERLYLYLHVIFTIFDPEYFLELLSARYPLGAVFLQITRYYGFRSWSVLSTLQLVLCPGASLLNDIDIKLLLRTKDFEIIIRTFYDTLNSASDKSVDCNTVIINTHIDNEIDFKCLRHIGDSSETHWRKTYLKGKQNVSLETNMPNRKATYLIADQFYMLDKACWVLMGLRSGMLVSDQVFLSPIKHVGLQGSPIRHVGLRG